MTFRCLIAGLVLLLPGPRPASAQPELPPAPVEVTTAIEGEVRRTVELSGSVEARHTSLVAAEVGGLVVERYVREGDRVEKGQPLVRLRQVDVNLRLRAKQGEIGEARSRLDLARSAHERAQGLYKEELISVEQLDNAVSELEAWQGRVAQLDAELDRLKAELYVTVVRAPFAGVIAAEHVAEGEWIAAGGPAVELVDTENLELALDVPESLISGLVKEEPVVVGFRALDGFEVEGAVRSVVPRADPQARTFPVKVRLPNANGRIGIGMLGHARLAAGAPESAVLVPKDALVPQGSARTVFRVNADERVEAVTVETGASAGLWIAVAGGIAAGDTVVVRGNERLMPGQAVASTPLEIPPPKARP
ncbi:MAG: efflux RND transporter periplasmic adaptor subunit [Thermoanaerobaculia bacterium]